MNTPVFVMPSPVKPPTQAETITNEWLGLYVRAAEMAGLQVSESERFSVKAVIYGAVTKAILETKQSDAKAAVTISREWAEQHQGTCCDCKRTALEMGADVEHFITYGVKRP